MPLLRASASDVTATIKASAQVNAAIGGASSKGGSSAPPPAGGFAAASAVVTQSAVAKSGSSTFSLLRTTAVAPPAPLPTPRTLTTSVNGQEDVFIIKTNSAGVTQWTARLSSPVSEFGYGIAAGPAGSVYVTGQMRSTTGVMTAFNWDGTAFGATLPNGTTNDVFIVKYNSGGLVQWVARIGGTADDISLGIAVSPVDDSVYIVGQSSFTRTVYNSNGTIFTTSTPSLNTDGFVVKYNSAGFGQWAATIKTGGGGDSGNAVATDSLGNVYVSGIGIFSTISITNGNGSEALTLPDDGSATSIVVKYNSGGTVQWAARQASTGLDTPYAVAVDSSRNVYVAGSYQSATLTVYNAGTSGTAFATTLANSGSNDVFIAKYNESGAVQWCARLESAGSEFGFSMATDSSGNVYIGGRYSSALTARNSNDTAFATTLATTGGTANAFLAKYNTTGSVQWIAKLDSPTEVQAVGISSDSSGNVYVTGSFRTSTTMFSQGGATAAFTATAVGNYDAFLAKYNASGVAQWLLPRGSTVLDKSFAVAADATGTTYQTGVYAGSMTPGTIVA